MQTVKRLVLGAAAVAALVAPISTASAQAVRPIGGLTAFPGNDDGSVGPVGIGFNINFFGLHTNTLYVNNNGNVTFASPLSTFTPFPIVTNGTSMLAPFFADVDTRAGNLTMYGNATVNGRNAFVVSWPDVGYFAFHNDLLDNFQLIIIDRSDIAPEDFDFEFNYNSMQWETGDASSGVGGLGGSCARMGYSNGSTNSFETAGSGVCGALINGGVDALNTHDLNSTVLGRYDFQVREGIVSTPGVVPEPATMTLLGTGLVGLAGMARRKRRNS